MIRHISIFKFQSRPENGRTKEENIRTVMACLESIPEKYPAIRSCTVRGPAGPAPEPPAGAGVVFGELVQIIDFAAPEDAAGYGPSAAHQELAALSRGMLEQVTAIDFEL